MSETETSPLSSCIASVTEVNNAFYRAFEALDLQAMAGVWSGRPSDLCIHPGWEILHGWENIADSWRSIFSSTGFVKVGASDVVVVVSGDIAHLACIETLYTVSEGMTLHGRVASSKIFHRLDGAWRLVLHHGSAIAEEEETGPILLDPDDIN